MNLGEVIGKINNPMRILIVGTDGTEIYKGYRGNYQTKVNDDSKVVALELFTEITKRNNEKLPIELPVLASTENGEKLPDQITEMRFSDLSHKIFQKITIRK